MSNQRGLTLETPDHYDLPIQPVDYVVKNNIGFLEGNVIKYVTRHHNKGREEDIKKAIHFLILVLRTEYGIDASVTYSPVNQAGSAFAPEERAVGLMEWFFRSPEYCRRYANVH